MQMQTAQVNYGHTITREPTDGFALHCHPYYECYYFISGDVRYLVEGVAYTPAPQSLLLFASGVFHGVQIVTNTPYERCTLHFDPACLPADSSGTLLSPFHTGGIYHIQVDRYRLMDFFTAIEECAKMPPALRDIALPLRIAALLTQLCCIRGGGGDPPQPPEGGALERQVITHINEHLTEPLSLDGIARHFFISRNQLCRTFTKATGTTVGAYIRQKRLILAEQLRAHGQSAGEAAANAGFADYSTYYRTHCRLLRKAPTAPGDELEPVYTQK